MCIAHMYGSLSLQIARDMERWAKNLNAAKTTQKQQLQALIQLERAEVVARVTEQQQQQPLPATPVSAVKRSGISLSAALEVLVYMYIHACTCASCACVYCTYSTCTCACTSNVNTVCLGCIDLLYSAPHSRRMPVRRQL